jgi:aryl sulfotransferase
VSADVIWLASYPKSGNTWMRALITNYLSDDDSPADINELSGGPIASSRVFFDEWVGLEASMLEPAVVDRLRPEAYRRWADASTGKWYLKVHDTWRRTDRGDPLFPADVTRGVVYVVRNPLDLVASSANHWGVEPAEAVEQLCGRATPAAGRAARLSEQLPQALGSWSDHVRSWIDESGLPVLLVRYEDLHGDPEESFRAVVRFCGLEEDGDRVRRAVRFASFSELSRQELSGEFIERPGLARGRFFRSGEVGGWRHELSPPLARAIVEANRPMMERLGYLDTAEGAGDSSGADEVS